MIAISGWYPDVAPPPVTEGEWVFLNFGPRIPKPPPSAPPNRHERRRQAALERSRAHLSSLTERTKE